MLKNIRNNTQDVKETGAKREQSVVTLNKFVEKIKKIYLSFGSKKLKISIVNIECLSFVEVLFDSFKFLTYNGLLITLLISRNDHGEF